MLDAKNKNKKNNEMFKSTILKDSPKKIKINKNK